MSDNHNDDRGPHSDAAHPDAASHELALPTDDPFADPGLPHHHPRRTDVDERAAKRAERQVSALFTLSTLCTIGFVVCYVGIDKDKTIRVQTLGRVNALNFGLGLTLGGALLCIGIGAIHWARKLMNSEEIVDYRHPMKSSAKDTAEVLEMAKAGAADSALPRRKMIWMSLAGAMAAFPITLLVPLRDLGPLPHKKLRETLWKDPARRELVKANGGARIRPEDIQVGSQISAKPTGNVNLDELAKAAIMLIRLRPEDVRDPEQLNKSYQGIMAFSKICTHAGCPLGLYEQTTHHMLCPCHQSTFDLSRGGKVIFGPAARNLPQLALTVNAQGYLVARGDFDQPVGPSFWERGR
jgi:ubiquinol-cytochrome c reductase iron-sulfur subunit